MTDAKDYVRLMTTRLGMSRCQGDTLS